MPADYGVAGSSGTVGQGVSSGVNAPASIFYPAAGPGNYHVISSAECTGGIGGGNALQIQDGTQITKNLDLSVNTVFSWNPPLKLSTNNSLTLTITGSAGAVPAVHLNIVHWVESNGQMITVYQANFQNPNMSQFVAAMI